MQASQIGATAAYAFAHFGINGTFEDYIWSFHRLSELGFRIFNLEILEDYQTDLFTEDRVQKFRSLAKELGISLPIFTSYYCENNLASISEERRQLGIEQFRFSAETAVKLGSDVINFASEFPPELVKAYHAEYIHSPADRVCVPAGMSWAAIWRNYAEAVRSCADIAAEHNLRLSVEPRAGCIVSTADSFLRLADHVDRTNLGCSFDIMHAHYQREDIPTSIKKLGSLLMDIQVSDADGQTLSHLPIGEGNVDFSALVHTLDELNFKGIVGLEIMLGDIDTAYRDSRIAFEHLCEDAKVSA